MPKTCVCTLQHTDGTRRLERLIARTNPSHHVQHLILILSVKMLLPWAVVNNPPRFQGPIGAGYDSSVSTLPCPFVPWWWRTAMFILDWLLTSRTPPQKKKNPKHTSKQKTTHSQQTRKHTLFPATTKVLFLTLILLPLSYSQGFVATHSPNTPKLLFQQKPRQIFRHTRLPTTPEKINHDLYSLNLQLSKLYHLSNLPDPPNQTDAVSLP